MCGIAGIFLRDPAALPDAATLDALARALAHRGPDGEGRHVVPGAGLVQRRLAIIDLVTGDQPLHEPGGAALIANGEIYNYRELRAAMPGARFATQSDCEPPLHLYRSDGAGFARHLRGMYAIAIHDRGARRALLSRDPFGIKPLYVAETAAGLAFASEPQALVAAGLVAPRLDARARDELLQMQFTAGAETIFAGIRRLLPGETVLVQEGRIVARERQPALPEGGPEAIDAEAALDRFDRALAESVELHQRSDVPYGMFLSGGTDSAAILAMMARLNPRPVLAYTAGFDAPGAADEREAARATAKAAGAAHEELLITERMVWDHLPEIVAAIDDPAADYAIIPTWFLGRRARADVKVVLSGEGGDELLAGYGRYRSAMRPWWLGGRVMRARGTFDRLPLLRQPAGNWRDGLAAAEAAANRPGRSRLQIAQATDCADWLPNDLLIKLDRCLMAHGVEGRTPFLDPGVAAAAFRLPDALKVREGRGKWLLRQWLSRHFPAARPFARKQGFTVPIGTWIEGQAARFAPLLAADAAIAEIARPEDVAALLRRPLGKHGGFAAWSLLFYALWHRRHMRGLPPAGDVFDTLAAR
ncbi:MAG: asparagine synthase (glutamine-hydrolyzing) [Alphaproteobacteria bacterium]|nr:asparagine synthase (glutamine-hydrolyzing) [Alphaproteobacteria bacterium]